MEEEIIEMGMEELGKKSEIFGDDGGAFKIGNQWIVITNDMLVESTDVIKEMEPKDVGFKAVTMNISDLVAMGAKPLYFAFSIGISENNIQKSRFYFKGIAEALDFYNIKLISADTNSAKELIIDGMAVGTAEKLLLRKNAKPGQVVCVTGDLGKTISALLISLKGMDADGKMRESFFEKILRPKARIDVVDNLSKFSDCAIDISDGLVKELKSISKASKCGIVIHPENIPISDAVLEFCNQNSLDPVEIAMNSGEEYEIVFTADRDSLEFMEFDFSVIGEVVDSEGVWLKEDSGLKKAEDISWKHFSEKWVI